MAISYYLNEIGVALGWLLALLALSGAISIFMRGKKKPSLVACSLALALGVWIFQCLTPVGLEARHLTPAMPALIVLAMAGLHWITPRTGGRIGAAAGLLALFFAWPPYPPACGSAPGYGSIGNDIALSPFRIPKKQWGGFRPLAMTVTLR